MGLDLWVTVESLMVGAHRLSTFCFLVKIPLSCTLSSDKLQ